MTALNTQIQRNDTLANKVTRGLKHTPIWALEHGIRDIAFSAAVLSTTGGPGYASKMTAGVVTPIRILYNGSVAYFYQTGFGKVLNSFALETMKAVGQIADNIVNRADETLYAALLTYIACKTVPTISKWARNRYIR